MPKRGAMAPRSSTSARASLAPKELCLLEWCRIVVDGHILREEAQSAAHPETANENLVRSLFDSSVTGDSQPRPFGCPGLDETQPITFMSRIIPTSEFSAETLIASGQREAAKHPGLLSVWFYTSAEEGRLFQSDSFTFERSFETWAELHRELFPHRWKIGRYLAFNGSAVLNMRDEAGGVYRRVVSGSDFLSIQEDGRFIDILDMSMRAPSSDTPIPDLTVYARSRGSLDATSAKLVWNRFRGVKVRMLSVVVQIAPWFIYDFGASVFYPFDTNTRVPSPAEAAKLSRIHCTGQPSDAAPSCTFWVGNHLAPR
jgi:hypothetical protein